MSNDDRQVPGVNHQSVWWNAAQEISVRYLTFVAEIFLRVFADQEPGNAVGPNGQPLKTLDDVRSAFQGIGGIESIIKGATIEEKEMLIGSLSSLAAYGFLRDNLVDQFAKDGDMANMPNQAYFAVRGYDNTVRAELKQVVSGTQVAVAERDESGQE